jgi:hypothetical protein
MRVVRVNKGSRGFPFRGSVGGVITRKQVTAWNFLWYWDMYFCRLKLTCPGIFLKRGLFGFKEFVPYFCRSLYYMYRVFHKISGQAGHVKQKH